MAQPISLEPISGLGLPETDLMVTFTNLAKTALSFLGVALVIMLIYGGMLYMTSGGNEDAKKKGSATIKNAIIGFIVVMLAPSIATFVVDALNKSQVGQ